MNEEELLTITPTPTEVPTPTPIDYTELLTGIKQEIGEMRMELRQEIGVANEEMYLIGRDVRIILALVLLSFCWSCMRQWRKNVLKGAK